MPLCRLGGCNAMLHLITLILQGCGSNHAHSHLSYLLWAPILEWFVPKVFKKIGPITASFCVYFRSLLLPITFTGLSPTILIKIRGSCAWDWNHGLQDGRCRQNHKAMAANPTCRLKVRWYIWLNRRTSQVTLCATCCSINFHLKQLSTKVIRLKVENRTPSSLIPRRILLKFYPKKLLLHAVGSSATRFGEISQTNWPKSLQIFGGLYF